MLLYHADFFFIISLFFPVAATHVHEYLKLLEHHRLSFHLRVFCAALLCLFVFFFREGKSKMSNVIEKRINGSYANSVLNGTISQ